MDKEILNIIVELTKAGGVSVVWLVLGIQVLKIIQSSIGWIFILWIAQMVTSLIRSLFMFCIEKDVKYMEKESIK